ncbi:hypothetical protein C8Q80DRAFT_942975 [Daedaleopsis nitida]|nr:hypothetical protein C8Q80DRAFT_942975 [Daedaleopsis nitida]
MQIALRNPCNALLRQCNPPRCASAQLFHARREWAVDGSSSSSPHRAPPRAVRTRPPSTPGCARGVSALFASRRGRMRSSEVCHHACPSPSFRRRPLGLRNSLRQLEPSCACAITGHVGFAVPENFDCISRRMQRPASAIHQLSCIHRRSRTSSPHDRRRMWRAPAFWTDRRTMDQQTLRVRSTNIPTRRHFPMHFPLQIRPAPKPQAFKLQDSNGSYQSPSQCWYTLTAVILIAIRRQWKLPFIVKFILSPAAHRVSGTSALWV